MKIFYFFIKKIITKKIVVWLRGSHNSVLHRFVNLPKEKIEYFYSKLTGKTWIEFYSDRLNKFAIQNKLLKKEINNSYIIEGKNDLKYLIKILKTILRVHYQAREIWKMESYIIILN